MKISSSIPTYKRLLIFRDICTVINLCLLKPFGYVKWYSLVYTDMDIYVPLINDNNRSTLQTRSLFNSNKIHPSSMNGDLSPMYSV